ncbi:MULTISPECIES: hypothetical protein [unclassified Neorhizobium]|uniref:hypothetical protein n=1 Tax=unclassified Neorhizobium TaxID=2629175 RepID=UPI001FF21C0F|nr:MULTISPECIES: hypothetical protein [unclassified Neorhizobium]MCJ9674449.1 hypothetical protein [Neorhizobium sp. SHOUNA12B]MCJ9746578.1 hypothetical protein [Neorhizobium sp. SHOUNA12A]
MMAEKLWSVLSDLIAMRLNFEFVLEILDEVPPFVEFGVERQRDAGLGCWEMTIFAPRSLHRYGIGRDRHVPNGHR